MNYQKIINQIIFYEKQNGVEVMKNYIRVIVLFILLAAIFPAANFLAQDADKPNSAKKTQQEKTKKEKDRDKAEKKRVSKEAEKSKAQEKEHPGQGAAYGKNKGDLSGREFGQWRSEQARAKVKTKMKEVEDQVTKSETVLRESRTKLEAAKFELARKEKAGGFSSDEQLKRRERIKVAEEKVKQLETAIEKEKTVLRQMKDEIADQATEAEKRQE